MVFKITKTQIVAVLAGALLLGWIGFHPYRQAQPEELTPTMRELLRQQLFGLKFDSKLHRATLQTEVTRGGAKTTLIL